MKKAELQSAIEQYIALNSDIESVIARAVSSGAIDVESVKENDYGTIKAIAHSVLAVLAEGMKPRHSAYVQYSENIQLFL